MSGDLITATPGELADQLGEADAALQQASDRMDALTRELLRRGVHRATGRRYGVVLDGHQALVFDLRRIRGAVNGDGEACAER